MIQRQERIAAFHWPLPASGTTAESALRRDAALLPVPPAGGAALRRQRWGAATPAAPLQLKGGRWSEGEEAAGEGGTVGVHTKMRGRVNLSTRCKALGHSYRHRDSHRDCHLAVTVTVASNRGSVCVTA